MQVNLIDKHNNKFSARIEVFENDDLKHVNHTWKFNWRALFHKNDLFFKIVYDNKVQGIIKLQEENNLYYVLKNIEVAPWNYGSKGKYKNVAEILISLACLKSFELNKGNYRGFLVFTSKGNLIEYYQNKYNAELIFRERMMIQPHKGKQLIKTYLNIELNDEE